MTARDFLTADHRIATAERAVLDAAYALARAQTEVEAATDAWRAVPDLPLCGAKYDRLKAARRVAHAAADHLHDIASRELAAELADADVPAFLAHRVNGSRP